MKDRDVASPESDKPFKEIDFATLKKRKRDYISLLTFMILFYIIFFPITKISPPDNDFQMIFLGVTGVLMFVFLYRVTSNFYTSKWIRGGYGLLIILQLAFNSYINLIPNTEITTLVVPASIGYTISLILLSLVFYILLQDIFSNKHDLTYSLLGASNIYFMIPSIFSCVYSLIALHNPSIVNADLHSIKTLLFNCMDYSWYVLAGIDYPEKIGGQLQSIAILESISGNLFIVFIIGRLMSK